MTPQERLNAKALRDNQGHKRKSSCFLCAFSFSSASASLRLRFASGKLARSRRARYDLNCENLIRFISNWEGL
jgi:hypothetical protein